MPLASFVSGVGEGGGCGEALPTMSMIIPYDTNTAENKEKKKNYENGARAREMSTILQYYFLRTRTVQ